MTDGPGGRLIAIDGTRGADVSDCANALAERLRRQDATCGVSRWDASGLFTDLMAGECATRHVSARMLTLLFAADLAFRLRWEIRPALAAGAIVIAAPYVDTAVAFGAACGLPREWLRQVFRFALDPDVHGRTRERQRRRGWKARPDRGYGECAAALLKARPAGFKKRRARAAMVDALDTPASRARVTLSRRNLRELSSAIVRSSPPAAAGPSGGRLRIARR